MKYLFLLLFLVLNNSIFAQNKARTLSPKTYNHIKHKAWELGALAGSAVYTGDVHCEKFFLKAVNTGGGVYGRYYFNDQVSTRLNLQYSNVKGDDSNYGSQHQGRNITFKSRIFDSNLTLEWEPFAQNRYNGTPFDFRKIFSPYFNIGIGGLYSKPKVNFSENNTTAEPNSINIDRQNSEYWHAVIPFGAGFRYDLTKQFTVGLEGSFRKTFSDYIDGVSMAGNNSRKDWYYTANVMVGYLFKFDKDADKDGVLDEQDACPLNPGTLATKGCPDMDSDGIPDVIDNCPNKKGVRALAGCPDRDGDLVSDDFDACPDQFGEARYNGCADTDFDGVLDSDDECPTTKGLYKYKGCPDTDEDGVADKYDKCPDVRGLADFVGCPPNDTNGDGLVDALDGLAAAKQKQEREKSSDTVNNVAEETVVKNSQDDSKSSKIAKIQPKFQNTTANNTPEYNNQPNDQRNSNKVLTYSEAVNNESMAVFSEALYGIQFEIGTATLKSKSTKVLDKVVYYMQKNTSINYEIGGHTDNQGDAMESQKLSESRAKAVKDYLVSKGVLQQRLIYKGYGDTNPIDNNDNNIGRLLNRRIVFSSF